MLWVRCLIGDELTTVGLDQQALLVLNELANSFFLFLEKDLVLKYPCITSVKTI